jgi:hypothetical protein
MRFKKSVSHLIYNSSMDSENHSNWNIPDEHSDLSLEDISPLSEKLQSMYARVEHKDGLALSPVNILSLLDMFRALEYHYDNFTTFVSEVPFSPQRRSAADEDLIRKAKFEAAAYINTVGQIGDWTHATSTSCPIIDDIWKTFRSKYTAHRSIDLRRSADTAIARELHLWVFQGQLWSHDGDLLFQIQLSQGDLHQINIRTGHETIQAEIENVFSTLMTV